MTMRKLSPLDEYARQTRRRERGKSDRQFRKSHAAYQEMESRRAGNFFNPQDGTAPGFSSSGNTSSTATTTQRRVRRERRLRLVRPMTICPVCSARVRESKLQRHLRRIHGKKI